MKEGNLVAQVSIFKGDDTIAEEAVVLEPTEHTAEGEVEVRFIDPVDPRCQYYIRFSAVELMRLLLMKEED